MAVQSSATNKGLLGQTLYGNTAGWTCLCLACLSSYKTYVKADNNNKYIQQKCSIYKTIHYFVDWMQIYLNTSMLKWRLLHFN